jgi:PAS domain-containing protein
VSNALHKYQPYDIQYRYVLPSGQIKYLHSMADAFINEAGETEKMLGTVQDITQHVITQQALERSEKVLKVAQRIAKVGNWEWDIIEDKRYYSDEMLNIYGLKQSNVHSYQTFVDFYHPEDRETMINVVTEALRNLQLLT